MLVEDLMEALGEAEQETTLGLVAKEFTQTNKAHKTMFQVRVQSLSRYRIGWRSRVQLILSQSSDWRRCSTSQASDVTKSETQDPLPPKYKVKYPEDASVRSVKISPAHKIVLQGLCQNLQPFKVLVNK